MGLAQNPRVGDIDPCGVTPSDWARRGLSEYPEGVVHHHLRHGDRLRAVVDDLHLNHAALGQGDRVQVLMLDEEF